MWTSHDPPDQDLDDLPHDVELTQYGTVWWFKNRLVG